MNYTELLEKIDQALPSLKGQLSIDRVEYSRKTNRAVIYFLSETVVGREDFTVLKKTLQHALPLLDFSLRVASPGLADAFLRDPGVYAGVLNGILTRAFPSAVSWLNDIVWVGEQGAVILELPDAFAVDYLKEENAQRILSNAIHDVFRIQPPIDFRVKDDFDKRLQRIKETREREKEELDAALQASELKPKKKENVRRRRLQIKGRAIAEKPVPIKGLNETSGRVTVEGKIVSVERKDIPGKEMVLLSFIVTDYTDSIKCKLFLRYRASRFKGEEEDIAITEDEIKALEHIVSQIQEDKGIRVRGTCQHDTFDNALVLMARDIMHVDLPERMDNAPVKRVELHAHTQMSALDGVMSPTELINRAAQWGHVAVAITDHGVVQAFPEAFSAAARAKIRLIPGLEAYMIDSENIVRHAVHMPIQAPITVIDFETTGLNTKVERIIEIGAVRLENGQITDTFTSYVNPGVPLKPVITQITGITDQDLMDAPSAAEVLPKLLSFIGTSPIAAHNIEFDSSILKHELKRLDLAFDAPEIDTLSFAQKLYPQLNRYRLSNVCKYLGVSLKNAHRAIHDATATAQCLDIMLKNIMEQGAETIADIDVYTKGYTKTKSMHTVLLVKNRQGLENINRIVSLAHLEYFHVTPKVPRDVIQQYREGIFVGSACSEGELFQAVLRGEPDTVLEDIASFYDYLEVQPVGNHALLVSKGIVRDRDELVHINQKIVSLGSKLGIPVAATGDAHYLEEEDAIVRKILHHSQHSSDYDLLPVMNFKTTEEMLVEFTPYLGEEKAEEIVITVPHTIAAQIEEISLYPKHPENKTTFSPVWEEAEDEIETMARQNAQALYGDNLPDLIKARLDRELSAIIGYGYATLYSIANKLVSMSEADGYLVGSRGSIGSSFVARMCNITEVNPLPPHYRCARCRTSDFDVPREYKVGIDLPDRMCSHCGQQMIKDGYDIPFEVFLGFKGDKVPDIDLNFSGEYQSTAHAYVEELFGSGYVYRAGTIGTLQEKTAISMINKYYEERGEAISSAEAMRLASRCTGVKRTTGQHPGGMVILPKEYDIAQFTAVQHPADDKDKNVVTTHFDFGSMHDILVKLDVLGHDDPTMVHKLEKLTDTNYRDIPLDDAQVMSLFTSPDALGISADDIGCQTGTLGIPEFGTPFVRQMLLDTKPTTMEELIRVSGLSHGTGVWLGNTKDIISSGIAPLSECICTREDIMNYLISVGLPTKLSFDAMENVRKGRKLTQEMEAAMVAAQVPDWFIESCNKIGYMFPKGHAVAYVIMALRVGWYKVYHPLAYYAAYFSIRADRFDAVTMIKPASYIREMLETLYQADTREQTMAEKEDIVTLEIVNEMCARGYSFLPPDLNKSAVSDFLIEGNALRAPFRSLKGFGEQAAISIIEGRHEPFLSIEDLKARTKVNTTCIDTLRAVGALKGLSETNQLDLFSFL